MSRAFILIQVLWLVSTIGSLYFTVRLRRTSGSMSMRASEGEVAAKYFREQGHAWTATGVEIFIALATRALTVLFLPENWLMLIVLSIAIFGRAYQWHRLRAAYRSMSK